MSELLGIVGFALVGSGTPGPNNALLWASGLRFGFRRTLRHVAGSAVGVGSLVAAAAAGIGVVVLAVPGADLGLKIIGSVYLLYLAVRIAGGVGSGRAVASRPLGVWHAAAFQFANPKAWLFALAAAGTFRLPQLPPVAAAVALTVTCVVVVLATATGWAAGGAALHRLIEGRRAQRVVSITLAAILTASVALIWT
jgi:threonine/homoserine/homoserine lactone efflux protein